MSRIHDGFDADMLGALAKIVFSKITSIGQQPDDASNRGIRIRLYAWRTPALERSQLDIIAGDPILGWIKRMALTGPQASQIAGQDNWQIEIA